MSLPDSQPVVPLVDPWLPETVAIDEITAEVGGVATYHLRLIDAEAQSRYRFAPGQFNMLYLPGAGEIAISISDDPRRRDRVAHTVREVGNVTRTLASMQVGDTLGMRGPFGSAWPMSDCIGRDVVVVAGGIGLAPLRPVIYALLADRRKFGRLNLLYGARDPGARLYAGEYVDWTAGGLLVHTTVDRSSSDWLGHVGVVTMLLERLRTFDPNNTVLFCCGPEIMMRFAARTALQRGIPAERIWISLERNMQCAVGLCGHCQLGPEFVCKDGPVFRYDKIVRWLAVEGL